MHYFIEFINFISFTPFDFGLGESGRKVLIEVFALCAGLLTSLGGMKQAWSIFNMDEGVDLKALDLGSQRNLCIGFFMWTLFILASGSTIALIFDVLLTLSFGYIWYKRRQYSKYSTQS